jgi:hypothetical protein
MGFNAMPDMRTYPQKARDRITGSKIITRLIKHVEGEIDLTPAQVASARILLSKVLPDLKSVDLKGRIETVSAYRLTDEQLMFFASGGMRQEAIDGECSAVQEPLKLVADQVTASMPRNRSEGV